MKPRGVDRLSNSGRCSIVSREIGQRIKELKTKGVAGRGGRGTVRRRKEPRYSDKALPIDKWPRGTRTHRRIHRGDPAFRYRAPSRLFRAPFPPFFSFFLLAREFPDVSPAPSFPVNAFVRPLDSELVGESSARKILIDRTHCQTRFYCAFYRRVLFLPIKIVSFRPLFVKLYIFI